MHFDKIINFSPQYSLGNSLWKTVTSIVRERENKFFDTKFTNECWGEKLMILSKCMVLLENGLGRMASKVQVLEYKFLLEKVLLGSQL
jgi:hypothetical protein